ncbi:MAG: S-layer homology domain-containing protein [Oscillospiraceae bacterium]|nr:S-layer homology domain-containing protein [Oscillospiraceae bacterium]
MTRRRFPAVLLLVAAVLAGFALAAGGDADDPLISLDYLTEVFAPAAEDAAQKALDEAGEAVYEAAEAQWRAGVDAAGAGASMERARTWTQALLKHGDVLTLPTGSQVLLLSGSVSAQYETGAVVDATAGTELPSGGELAAQHRYLTAEDTTARFTVVSRTAVVEYCGAYHFSYSNATPDYNAMATALRTLHLFRGSTTGYGEGFDLELTPTRIQALVMLIRLLGEEEDALACTGVSPFDDVPASYWGAPYVAYAVQKGYTNGVGNNCFAPNVDASAPMFVEFILRALGYSSTAQTDVSTAASRARAAGVMTAGELAVLDTVDFLRADIVYLSWYALETPVAQNMETLHRKLEGMGVFTAADYRAARALVTSARL